MNEEFTGENGKMQPALPQEQGEWIPRYPSVDNWVYECSKCGEYEFARPWRWGYCPDCGKPMKRVELDEE